MTRRWLGVATLAAIAAFTIATAPALAGKLGQKLDQESEKSKDIGIQVSGSSTPAKKFTLKVNMSRKVDIDVSINTSCRKPDGKTSVNKQLNFSRRGSFKKAFKARPAKNASCSTRAVLNTDVLPKRVKVTAKLFHKRWDPRDHSISPWTNGLRITSPAWRD